MGDKTKIEWADATWNPLAGCSRVSPGCDNCYAILQTHRMKYNPNTKISDAYAGLTTVKNLQAGARIDWTSQLRLLPERLSVPERWKRPRRIFVNSLSDLFHVRVPIEYQAAVFRVMGDLAPQHIYQVLTKRPELMRQFIEHDVQNALSTTRATWPLPNVWLGTSVENADYVHRIDELRQIPAAVRFLSLEPLLGPLPNLNLDGIGWVIVGGESGPHARALVKRCPNCGGGAPASFCSYCKGQPWQPTEEALGWVRDIRDQCIAADVPFLFKQWGGHRPETGDGAGRGPAPIDHDLQLVPAGPWAP